MCSSCYLFVTPNAGCQMCANLVLVSGCPHSYAVDHSLTHSRQGIVDLGCGPSSYHIANGCIDNQHFFGRLCRARRLKAHAVNVAGIGPPVCAMVMGLSSMGGQTSTQSGCSTASAGGVVAMLVNGCRLCFTVVHACGTTGTSVGTTTAMTTFLVAWTTLCVADTVHPPPCGRAPTL